MPEEIFVNSQTVIFFQQTLAKPEKIWSELSDKFPNIFDQPPLILPIPNQSEISQVPVVQISSSNGVYRINISRKRVDFFVAGEGKQKFSDKKDSILEKSVILFNFFKNLTKVSRIAFIVRNFIEEDNAVKVLSNLLLPGFTSLYEGDVFDSHIRYTTRHDFEAFKINNYSLVEKSEVNININNTIKKSTGILITRDFNTIPENDLSEQIDGSSFTNFISMASNFVSDISNIKRILWEKKEQKQPL
ncbi:TPA: hypothetical protein DEQ22_00940 [Candidatus Nomurabacteria bacterium]|uniref:TIGR04255 family protein n=2 Tax=Candidatus Nomuraibacteriota TaxID=1752729 RepID=A0A1F6YLQ6_9BACT|nr:MAG: hypothetical protein UV13_C0002G0031 [Parcubacteria group bacterium GW2011_GWC1_42_21]KKS58619.1 MAG: hypothetical protein UV23_C0003G0003 [Candidatus Nomurabacteria bacterium GW2011_GWF1_42_40]KKT00382.1 MAG: hypothetical protein UV77_C0004G0014 [Candidatus Nomurabacteria bacterium GW2011_GWA1_43_17]KKT07525.1 MAG: hypothetical protein UV85_C0010G0003 [Candidatus Nomurabacteria bacterium GW2011_GWB1_43_19]KKT11335.1 MAG: hypothetical protein UV91_C0007G0035 [Candidatus Nomurabacteria b